jgi:hypothetical protein
MGGIMKKPIEVTSRARGIVAYYKDGQEAYRTPAGAMTFRITYDDGSWDEMTEQPAPFELPHEVKAAADIVGDITQLEPEVLRR